MADPHNAGPQRRARVNMLQNMLLDAAHDPLSGHAGITSGGAPTNDTLTLHVLISMRW